MIVGLRVEQSPSNSDVKNLSKIEWRYEYKWEVAWWTWKSEKQTKKVYDIRRSNSCRFLAESLNVQNIAITAWKGYDSTCSNYWRSSLSSKYCYEAFKSYKLISKLVPKLYTGVALCNASYSVTNCKPWNKNYDILTFTECSIKLSQDVKKFLS